MKKFASLLIFVLLVVGAITTPALSQDDKMCVTINGNQLCGSATDIIAILEALDDVDDGEVADANSSFTITGVPDAVQMPEHDVERDFTLGFGTEFWISEPGGLTADPGDRRCQRNEVCWEISPDNQFKMTGEVEYIDLREDAWTLTTLSYGTFEIGEVTITLSTVPLHNWTLVLHGKWPARGDHNTQVVLTDHNPGFGMTTNIPVSARLSEDYLLEQVENTYKPDTDVCGGGCDNGNSIMFFDINTSGYVVITQTSENAEWEILATNIVND